MIVWKVWTDIFETGASATDAEFCGWFKIGIDM